MGGSSRDPAMSLVARVPPGALAALTLAAATLGALALSQSIVGRPFLRRVAIVPHPLPDSPAHAATFAFPARLRHALTDTRTILLEDGRGLGPRLARSDRATALGRGRHSIRKGTVTFSSTDNTDPSTNGRRYEALVPVRVRDRAVAGVLLVFLLGAAAMFSHPATKTRRAPSARERRRRPAALAAAVFVAALLWHGFLLFTHPDHSAGTFVIKGMPFSDAVGWNELAIALAEGRGLDAWDGGQRPFHGVLLGSIYLMTGPWLPAAKLLNVGATSLSLALVFLLLDLSAGRLAALAAALALAVHERVLTWLHAVMTEPVALALLLLALHALWAGALLRRPGVLLAGGIFLGLSNLCAPYTLFAVPFLAAALALDALSSGPLPRPIRRAAGTVALLALGLALPLAPWVARQHARFGTWSISSNTAELLHAGACAGAGHFDNETVNEQARRAGVNVADPRARQPYFARLYREAVLADPLGYLSRVGAKTLAATRAPSWDAPATRLALAFFVPLLALALCRRRRSAIPLAFVPVFWVVFGQLPGWPAWAVLCAAAALACSAPDPGRRLAASFLVSLLLGCKLMVGLLGGTLHSREPFLTDWAALALVLLATRQAFDHLLAAIDRCASRANAPVHDATGVEHADAWNRFTRYAVWTTLLWCGVATAAVGASSIRGDRLSPAPAWRTTPERQAQVVAWARSSVPGITAETDLEADLVDLGSYRCFLRAGEDVEHRYDGFLARPYDRTLVIARTLRDGSWSILPSVFAGDVRELPARTPYLLVHEPPRVGAAEFARGYALIPAGAIERLPNVPGLVATPFPDATPLSRRLPARP